MRYLYIIAGNYNQFQNFSKQWYIKSPDSNTRLVYVTDANSMRGIVDPDGLCIGTWRERTDIDGIMQQLLLSCKSIEKINRVITVYDMV
jgi:hypothetical protein